MSMMVETPSDSTDVISKAVAEKCYVMVLVAMATTAVPKVTTVLVVMMIKVSTFPHGPAKPLLRRGMVKQKISKTKLMISFCCVLYKVLP